MFVYVRQHDHVLCKDFECKPTSSIPIIKSFAQNQTSFVEKFVCAFEKMANAVPNGKSVTLVEPKHGKETDRQADRQTDILTDSQTHRQTYSLN